MSAREDVIQAFLDAQGWGGAARRVLAADASFRRYLRLERDGEQAVLMDAPPPEDVRPFAQVASLLLSFGLSAPRPLAVDEAAGLMLLEDLGDATFTRVLARGGDEAALYRLAVDTLIALHRGWSPDLPCAAGLPAYDEKRLLDEALLLTDWFLPAVRGGPTPAPLRESYIAAWRAVFPVAQALPETLVLRDYHVDNLMVLEGRAGVAACGLLDFQDAVRGSPAYDLVSLLEDARRDIDPKLAEEMFRRYLAAFEGLDGAKLRAAMSVLGAQRNAKIIGIFTRLDRRDRKPDYLKHIPRVWRLLEGDLADPALAPVRAWFDREIPAAERIAPPRETAA
ncbi:MAG: phosphotransferase [Kiloniellales bacterium]|nr:phosphotransferase [Kiloniellales bacterium]